jgi:hypothetical protein
MSNGAEMDQCWLWCSKNDEQEGHTKRVHTTAGPVQS